jgi:D-alanyl-D-alanine carboxypeptidase
LAAAPEISAQAAIIIEEPCGAILYELDSHHRYPTASLAKIATALVTAEHADPTAYVDITIDGVALALETDSSVMGLLPGQSLTVEDLLYGLLLPSGNDAARMLADYVSGDRAVFVGLMNAKARELGLTDTHFVSPDGLDDPDQYTSANDITILARELLRNELLAPIVGTDTYQPDWDGPELWNTNPLLYSYSGAIGVKTGYTDEAREALVGAAERDGRRLIATVMRSEYIYLDVPELLDWAFDSVPSACSAAPVDPLHS